MTTIPSDLLNQVVCMDCFALMEQIPDASIDAIITDLPYGTTACSWDTVIPIEPMWAAVKRVLKPRGVFVTTASQPFTSALVMSNPKWFREALVWDKRITTGFLDANRKHMRQHEDVLIFAGNTPAYFPQMTPRGAKRTDKARNKVYGETDSPYGIRYAVAGEYDEMYPKSIITVSGANQTDKQHPTQKPVALYEYLIRTYTQADDVVLDFCCGSGTTAVAARNTGRRFIAGDSSAEYVAIASRRLAMPYTLPMMFGE